MDKVKQVILMRTDLNMRKGKMIAQGAHAAMAVILNMGKMQYANKSSAEHHPIDVVNDDPVVKPVEYEYASYILTIHDSPQEDVFKWVTGAFTKVCVGVSSEEELNELVARAREEGIPNAIMVDNGETEFRGISTVTCAAIGPAYSSKIDPITRHLPLL